MKKIEQLKYEEKIKLAELQVQSSESKIEILKPFVDRLDQLQNQVFVLPRDKVSVDLQAPEPNENRFPLVLGFYDKLYQIYWTYNDREKARLFYHTRSHLLAEPLYQLTPIDGYKVEYIFIGARVNHPGTGEKAGFDCVVS